MDGLNSKSMKAAQIELNGFNVFFFKADMELDRLENGGGSRRRESEYD